MLPRCPAAWCAPLQGDVAGRVPPQLLQWRQLLIYRELVHYVVSCRQSKWRISKGGCCARGGHAQRLATASPGRAHLRRRRRRPCRRSSGKGLGVEPRARVSVERNTDDRIRTVDRLRSRGSHCGRADAPLEGSTAAYIRPQAGVGGRTGVGHVGGEGLEICRRSSREISVQPWGRGAPHTDGHPHPPPRVGQWVSLPRRGAGCPPPRPTCRPPAARQKIAISSLSRPSSQAAAAQLGTERQARRVHEGQQRQHSSRSSSRYEYSRTA
eukprot:COSAG01_NODE_617_length_14808_cov_8.352437_3_plen_268_part_00